MVRAPLVAPNTSIMASSVAVDGRRRGRAREAACTKSDARRSAAADTQRPAEVASRPASLAIPAVPAIPAAV